MQYKRKCPVVCGTLLLIEAVEDDGNVFAGDSMDCPELPGVPWNRMETIRVGN